MATRPSSYGCSERLFTWASSSGAQTHSAGGKQVAAVTESNIRAMSTAWCKDKQLVKAEEVKLQSRHTQASGEGLRTVLGEDKGIGQSEIHGGQSQCSN